MEKKIIQTTVGENITVDRREILIDDLLQWIEKAKAEKATHLELYATYDWDDMDIDIWAYYKYEETETQCAERLQREQDYKKQQILEKLAKEKILYEELKKKFEA